MNQDLDEMIARGASRKEMHVAAVESGFRDLAEDAVRHVLGGMTSISEVSRVVDSKLKVFTVELWENNEVVMIRNASSVNILDIFGF